MIRAEKQTSPSKDPSLKDIREACRQIQMHWTEKERRRRAGLPKVEYWHPPLIPLDQGVNEAAELDE